MQLLRRFLVIQAFMLWQGGFVFYAAVVVPIGTELSSARDQGFVTQQVTNWLNYFGVAWCVMYAWDCATARRARTRWMLWIINLQLLVLLFAIHNILDKQIDIDAYRITDRTKFKDWHIAYLCISTAQWAISLLILAMSIWSWRHHDSAALHLKESYDRNPETL